MPVEEKGPVARLYAELEVHRSPYLDQARLNARYTVPSLFPPEGSSPGGKGLYKPFQSIGARGVNNVASKLVLTLLPPTRKFFRLVLENDLREKIPEDQRADWDAALSVMENRVQERVESLGVRVHTFEVMRNLVVAGNTLLFVHPEGSRVFTLGQYVIRRSPNGEPLEIVVKEVVAPQLLPEEMRPMIEYKINNPSEKEKTVDLYTHVRRVGRMWRVSQEVKGMLVPGSNGSYPLEKSPWLPLRWTRIDGEDYGLGLCHDYSGDLIAAESLSRSIIRAAAIAAKVVFLVNPNGNTDPSDLEKAVEGGFVDGSEGDVTALGVEKSADFGVARATLDDVIQRLSYAFLLNSAIRRNGERVTAEEIRYMASELEDALGGAYSVLSLEFQLPLVRAIMAVMQREGSMPHLPKNSIQPTIVTGIDALGRSHELARLDAFLSGAIATFGPEVAQYINMSEYLTRRAAGLDLDVKSLVKSPEEIAAVQQAAAAQAMAEKVGPQVVKTAGDLAASNGNPNG